MTAWEHFGAKPFLGSQPPAPTVAAPAPVKPTEQDDIEARVKAAMQEVNAREKLARP